MSAIGAIGRRRILVGHRGGRDPAPTVADSIASAEFAGDRPRQLAEPLLIRVSGSIARRFGAVTQETPANGPRPAEHEPAEDAGEQQRDRHDELVAFGPHRRGDG